MAFATASLSFMSAMAIGWPANYEGVMLQGFYWDSYKDTKWTNLESQADELSESFTLIWVPNSGRAASNPGMGYDPVYWFTNHNSAFGTEAQLRSMIKTFKAKGTGIIADVVINHRSGATNWTDFPAEQWNGKTWHIGTDGICCTDEVKNASGQATPTGAADTGEDFNGSRDLDHTNANVQDNCKNYCKFLLDDLGYAGFRYDMVKGYSGSFNKIYNEYSKPTYSVGEYWDGSYDAVKGWIDDTGKESAAFDFPCKYQINKAFAENDMTNLVWKANGTTDQPAGMIHFGYAQLAVTFVDNHDTYRDISKFSGNVPAANAFILCSPGTPCVFLPHWKMYKAEIKKLIAVRNAVGVHNCSRVRVIDSKKDLYIAEVTGTKGKLVVKIGPAMVTPDGYTDADIKACGNDYCVWSKVDVGGGGGDDPLPQTEVNIYFDNSNTNWATPHIHYWGASESDWPGVAMAKVEGNIWKYACPAGTTGLLFNAGDGDASKTGEFDAVHNHVYTTAGDQGEYQGGVDPTYPAKIYMVGTINNTSWATSTGLEPNTAENGVYTWNSVKFDPAAAGADAYFTFITALDATDGEWNGANQADRYGAPAKDTKIALNTPATVRLYKNQVDAMGAQSWAAPTGTYTTVLDLKNMTVTLKVPSSVTDIVAEGDDTQAVYYNLMGVRVDNPSTGVYIVRRSDKVTKEFVK